MKNFYKIFSCKLAILILSVFCLTAPSGFAQFPWSSGFEVADAVFTYNSTTNTAANIAGVPRTGSKCGGMTAGGTYNASIITPSITFTACKQYTVNVWARAVACTGKLRIMKSATATNAAMNAAPTADIILDAASNNVTSTTYALKTGTFTPQANETWYIGFQMTGTGGGPCNSINMYIDDISITEATPPAPVGGTATPAAGSVACNGSTTVTLAGSTGTIQWQKSIVGAGSGYTNISGATTTPLSTGALQITTYFRAVLTGGCATANSTVATVTVSGTGSNSWKTTGTTAWGTAANWSLGTVPTACSDVTIVSGGTQPSITAVANCKSLTVNSGANLTVSASLTNYGDLINNGNIGGTSTITLLGTGNSWGGTGTYVNGATQNGRITIGNLAVYTLTATSVTINSMNPGGVATTGQLSIGANTLILTGTLYNTFNLYYNTGTVEIRGGGSIDVAKSFYQTGALHINWESIDCSSAATCIFDLEDNYNSVWFSGNVGATKFGRDAIIVQLTGDNWIKTGTLDHSSAKTNTISIAGDWINDGNFLSATATVDLNGSGTNQEIKGASVTSFNKLKINNSTTSGVTLLTDANTSNATDGLRLEQNGLFLGGKKFTVQSGATTAVSRGTGYVVSETTNMLSKLQWNIGSTTGAHIYPFGRSDATYIPFTLNLTAGTIGNVDVATYSALTYTLPPGVTGTIASGALCFGSTADNTPYVTKRFWQINKTGASGTATVTFNSATNERPTNFTAADMRAQRYNTAYVHTGFADCDWEPPIAGQTAGTSGTDYVTVPGVTGFSPWVVANLVGIPLPLSLISFDAVLDKNIVQLNWITASETNNDYFTVERSVNASKWEEVTRVDATGNSNTTKKYDTKDDAPYPGVSYYRLKQTDFDGNFSYSDVVFVNVEEKNSTVLILPNPAKNTLEVISQDVLNSIYIYDARGKFIKSKTMSDSKSVNNVSIDVSDLPVGLYFISTSGKKRITHNKFIKE